MWAAGLNEGQENTEHAFYHLLAAPVTSARLQRLKVQHALWAEAKEGAVSSACPCTHPGTSPAKEGRTFLLPLPPNTQATPASHHSRTYVEGL